MSEKASAEASRSSGDDLFEQSTSEWSETSNGGSDLPAAAEAVSTGDKEADSDQRQANLAESLGVLSLRETIPANWEVIDELAEGNQAAVQAVAERALHYATYTPAIAGAIAQSQDPSLVVAWPTAQQIKHENVGLRVMSGILGFFSENWAAQFDGYIERKARERLQRAAQTVRRPLLIIGSFESPRMQFIDEMASMYRTIVPEGDKSSNQRSEDELSNVVQQLDNIYRSPSSSPDQNRKTSARYPLIGGLLESAAAFQLTVPSLPSMQQLKTAAPGIIRGLEQFLVEHGSHVPASPQTSPQSFRRSLTQRVAAELVGSTLEQLYELLPEDGHAFTAGVYQMCQQVNSLARQGVDGRAITDLLLKNLLKKRSDE